MLKYTLLFGTLILSISIFAQESWDLRRCVDYALQKNISIQQADIQAHLANLQLQQSKASQLPLLNFGSSGGYDFGRALTAFNTYTDNTVFNQSYYLSTSINLFNWASIRNNIKASKNNSEALLLDVERLKNDVSLNVTNAYLNLLLSIEQVEIAKQQIYLDTTQLFLTKKRVGVGSISELNMVQLESQLAIDSSIYFNNVSAVEVNKLSLMALLNIDAKQQIEVSIPDAAKIPLIPLSDLQPNEVYQLALQNQFKQRVDSLKIKAQEYSIMAIRASMYPTISSSGYLSSYFYQYYSNSFGGQPNYLSQIFKNNFSQGISLSLNVPIFNALQSRTAYLTAKETIKTLRLTKESDDLTLQQVIYKTYANAVAGLQTFNANTKATDYAEKAYGLGKIRYDLGMSSTSDYITLSTNLYKAKVSKTIARYNYIFLLKVLEFYKQNNISL